jgi:hypothetical protein
MTRITRRGKSLIPDLYEIFIKPNFPEQKKGKQVLPRKAITQKSEINTTESSNFFFSF